MPSPTYIHPFIQRVLRDTPKANLHMFIRYVIAGLINTFASFFSYAACLSWLGWPFWAANFAAMITGILCGFILARAFVFARTKTSVCASSWRYILTIIAQFIVSTGLIWLLVSVDISALLAYILILPIIMVLSFVLQKMWVFKISPDTAGTIES